MILLERDQIAIISKDSKISPYLE